MGVLRSAWIEYERDHARYFAVAMIYYAVLSLVPLLLLLLGTLGLLLRYSAMAADAHQRVLLAIDARFGEELTEMMSRLLATLYQNSIIATLISVAGLVFTASLLFRHLRLSFRAIWKHTPPLVSGPPRAAVSAVLLERVVAFLMVLGGGALLVTAFVLIAATRWITGGLIPELESLILAVIAFGALFKVLPPVSISWRHIWPAALLCAVIWVVAGELLLLYAAFTANSRSVYGALGWMLAIMLWMSIVSKALFFGAELCKVLATRKS